MSARDVPLPPVAERAWGDARPRGPRREHAADDTKRAIIAAARAAFARDGYAGTSLESIVGPAGVTKGALYHHFANKAGVLDAICVELKTELAARIRAAAVGETAAWPRIQAALATWCTMSAEPAYRRIALRDAPGVLGPRLREIEHATVLVALIERVRELADEGAIRPVPVDATARVLLAAAGEIAAWLADADDPAPACAEGAAVLRALLDGLRAA